MKSAHSELIWQGRIHIGDEPGIFGDAFFSGLCAEFPVTMRPFDEQPTPRSNVTVELTAEDVQVFGGYPGHELTIFAYELDPPSGPFKWKQTTLQQSRLLTNSSRVSIPNLGTYKYLSVQVRVDTTVAAGFYDDFVLVRLSLDSTTHYASFGFQA